MEKAPLLHVSNSMKAVTKYTNITREKKRLDESFCSEELVEIIRECKSKET